MTGERQGPGGESTDPLRDAMREALRLAGSPDAPRSENPRVGCVVLDPSGTVVGRGYHRGAGTPHAEIVALRDAGERAVGATAVVTLEPCRHVGRTGPCTTALLSAGIARVVFAQTDPNPAAAGGGAVLHSAGVDVIGGLMAAEAELVNEAWTFAVRHGRPLVTLKSAVSLDGRVAGPGGGPTAITGAEPRLMVHRLRSDVDAILVGTGTVLADDPALTVRLPEGGDRSPLRVVMGRRPIPEGARVMDGSAPSLQIEEHDPAAALATLAARGVQHVLLEGGPTLAAAFLDARLVDRLEWYLSGLLLGDGPPSLPVLATGPLGVDVVDVRVVGEDVRVTGRVIYEAAG